MQRVMDYEHPRIQTPNPETKLDEYKSMPCCKTKTGWHGLCRQESRRSDFDDYGVGSVLYFQFLKYMGCQFLIMFILGIPSMLFFYYGTELSETGFRSVVQSVSLGNLGTASNTCGKGEYFTDDGGLPQTN